MKRITKHPILPVPEGRKEVTFTFEGQVMTGYEGEMVASALFANGITDFSIHRKGDAPQGIFCANGQCAQCTLIIDGFPQKSCITPLAEGMELRRMIRVPELPPDDTPLHNYETKVYSCDVLIVGGGPSGLTASIELAKLGFRVMLVDDKEQLGGKLLLQTHKFFGSEEDCYAGTRGTDIAHKLEEEARSYSSIEILTGSSVVGIYKDQKAGIFAHGKQYILVDFKSIIVASGAREKSIVFPGNDLPGVYGAGAFQTLVNRDLIKASDRLFIVGSGNVGLIAGYHALQAGIHVVGLVEIQNEINGYKVHADKLRRIGVPISLRTTVLGAEGDGKVERVTVAEVDEKWNPLLETARTYEVDTLLIAAGLSEADELYDLAEKYGFIALKTGDADEIAEASSAMFGGRIAAFKIARMMGADVVIDDTLFKKAEVLKSRPGKVHTLPEYKPKAHFTPNFFCDQEIPCNPCTTVCPSNAIELEPKLGSIMDIPHLTGNCIGCGLCVAVCPGLAITLVKEEDEQDSIVMLPHEFIPDFSIGDHIPVTDQEGTVLIDAEVVKIVKNKKFGTYLVSVKVPQTLAPKIAGIKVQSDSVTTPLPETSVTHLPENGIVCRCERVSLGEVVSFIKENNVRDVNQLKLIRVGMGACGSKTCSVQMPMVFKAAGVDYSEVTEGTNRPLTVETPMFALVNEQTKKEG